MATRRKRRVVATVPAGSDARDSLPVLNETAARYADAQLNIDGGSIVVTTAQPPATS